nr:hypothetical protein [Colwellia sp.]
LADNATVLLKNHESSLPVKPADIKHIHLLVANEQEQQALQKAIVNQWQKSGQTQLKITSIIAEQGKTLAKIQNISQLIQADLVIVTVDIKAASVVDLGGIDDLLRQAVNTYKSSPLLAQQQLSQQQLSQETKIVEKKTTQKKANYGQLVKLQLAFAKEQKITSLLIAQGSPFLVTPFLNSADAVLLTFDDKIMVDNDGVNFSAGLNASIAIAIGMQQVKGVLPVTLSQ